MAYPESNMYPDTACINPLPVTESHPPATPDILCIRPPTPDTSCSSSLKKPEWLGINPPTPETSCSSSAKNPEIA